MAGVFHLFGAQEAPFFVSVFKEVRVYGSGAIFVKDEKIIPVINTALPRANQYFTAWHEIYHLMFDKVSFDHFIETDNTLEERKAEYFAACMLLNGVDRYFTELPEAEFVSKIFHCMSTFQAPYKSIMSVVQGDRHW